MKRLVLVLVVAAAGAFALVPAASAHPLGNFTINTFSRVEVSGQRVYVRYVLDLAEIPTFQAKQAGGIDAAVYARRIAAGARLRVDGNPTRLVPTAHALAFPKGAGGLRTTRLEVILRGPQVAGTSRITYRDTNYAGRLGWREIVVGADAKSRSDELRAYPKDLLSSPLHVTSVAASLTPTSDAPPTLTRGSALQAPDRVADSGFASLIAHEKLGAGFVLLSLLIAMFWGAAHALSPGHGKSIVAAYLVGSRGTARHAVFLGMTVTVTHTIGVFALGLVTLSLSAFIVPEQLYPWLNLVSGVLVVAIGATVFRSRFRHRGHTHDHHSHASGPGPGTGPSRRSLVAVGITGGLLPCPSALVVLLAAISLHRVAFGMLLIVAFSAGLALSITGIGLVAVYAKQVFKRASFEGRLVRLLPAASALVILAAGLAMTARALPKVH